ncbi:helix-turn-helix domain-containing protein [uncultured Psychroserpens sp.]|uniref:helix-turn-helix domain-containing protein n=1 Tax=uncultured Psychroserpens sp. TaxID=255436 RepID=UPI00261C0ED2|nr:helix-turn-helix domain-containing protein [uncultured Psychroserpens sp.]
MNHKTDIDIVNYFKSLVSSLSEKANEQKVILIFRSSIKNLIVSYNESYIESQLTKFLSKIILFTPQDEIVCVRFEKYYTQKHCLELIITNTGVDLSRLTELGSLISFENKIESINKGTKFTLEIPLAPSNKNHLDFNKSGRLMFNPYYLEINKRLTTYFSKIENLEKLAEDKSDKEGEFLKRVNLIIKTYLNDNNFRVSKLANAMAVSRTQLFRKVKYLTQMSPIQYILFIRLQIAKELLLEQSLGLNISEVSYKVGFISNSHFSRAFKKQFGVNPSTYIQNASGNNI